MSGEVVGINTFKAKSTAEGRPPEGLGFAVSEVTVQAQLPILKQEPSIARPPSTPNLPPNLTTYTDSQRLFSISYPQNWESGLSRIAELDDSVKDLLRSVDSDLPLEKAVVLFLAGVSVGGRFDPNVNIVAESLDVSSLDEAAEAEIGGVKSLSNDYKAFGQTKVVVGGREAVIVDHEYTIPGVPRIRALQMIMLDGRLVWITTCGTSPGNFLAVKETCDQIVRSFRILQ